MKIRTNQILAGLGLVFAFAVAAPSARANANLLIDPGFENNPLNDGMPNGYNYVLNHFVDNQGEWGAEKGTITGVQAGVTPPQGVKMLGMVNAGLDATQTVQVVDVTSYASLIDSGRAEFSLSALFNTPNGVIGDSSVFLYFFTGPSYNNNFNGLALANLILDGNDQTWQKILKNGVIPVNTRWLVAEVQYTNASIGTNAGYVDAAELTINSVPEPSSILSLVALGILGVGSTLKRKLKQQAGE
jgi:hypothetical protein